RDSKLRQNGRPLSIRTGLGIGRPAEREDDCFCGSLSILKADAPSILEPFQAGQARTGLKFNTVRPQPLDPRPQESGGFLSAWKQAATRSHIGFYSQRVRPLFHVCRAEFFQQITPAFLFCAISIGKILDRFTMGQIQAPASGDQKFPTKRTLRIAQDNRCAVYASDLRRAHSRGSAADDENRIHVATLAPTARFCLVETARE